MFTYNLFLRCYQLAIRLASIWNPKAKLWIQGRKNIFPSLKAQIPTTKSKVIWMHCASLGEFEQGRPLLEKIRTSYPSGFILLTFFSPSGYEVRKDFSGANLVAYLPMDGMRNANMFLDIVQPSLAIFVKYESWLYYLKSLSERAVPAILIAAIFKPEQNYFGFWGGYLRKMLNYYSHIFVQDHESLKLIQQYPVKAGISISGDTRFDRVAEIAAEHFQNQVIDSFCHNSKVVVAGSTWKEDEDLLSGYLNKHPEIKAVIAPHEIDEKTVNRIKTSFPNAITITEAGSQIPASTKVLIINSYGMLSKLYRWSTISYIGGGFNKAGIHNILEAAVYGKITLFGPRYQRSGEAEALIRLGGAFSFKNYTEMENLLDRLLEDKAYRQSGEDAAQIYIRQNLGATRVILNFIKELPNFKQL